MTREGIDIAREAVERLREGGDRTVITHDQAYESALLDVIQEVLDLLADHLLVRPRHAEK